MSRTRGTNLLRVRSADTLSEQSRRRAADSNGRPHVPYHPIPFPDEAELVRRLTAGDVDALTEISEWLWEPLAAYAYRILGDRDAAQDVAQVALVRLWEGRDSTPLKSPRGYLFRVVRNLALDQLKTRRTRRRLLRLHRPDRSRRPAVPDEVLERERVWNAVDRAIQELTERRREVFTLTYLCGLSYAEAGEVMGISPKTVHNQMTAALAQLRQRLRPLVAERRTGPAGEEKPEEAE